MPGRDRPTAATRRLAVATALAGLFVAATGRAAEVVVTVNGLGAGKGRVAAALHAASRADAFPAKEAAVAAQWRDVAFGPARFRFVGVPPGRYAVAVHHDADGDGALDTDLFGAPTEGVGFSGNATARDGAPAFGAAAFRVPAADSRVRTGIAIAD